MISNITPNQLGRTKCIHLTYLAQCQLKLAESKFSKNVKTPERMLFNLNLCQAFLLDTIKTLNIVFKNWGL